MRQISVDLELAGFEELRLVVGHGQGRKRHALLQHRHAPGVSRAAVGRVPAGAQGRGVLHRVGMREDARGPRAVGKEPAAVFLGRDAKADGRLFQRDGAVPHDAVKAEAGDVQHVLRREIRELSVGGRVGVGQLAPAVPVHGHAVGQQRIQPHDAAAARTDDLAIAVAVEKQMR